MTGITLEEAQKLIGKEVDIMVIIDRIENNKHIDKEEWCGGLVWKVEQDEFDSRYHWIIFDWGWGVRIDAVEKLEVKP